MPHCSSEPTTEASGPRNADLGPAGVPRRRILEKKIHDQMKEIKMLGLPSTYIVPGGRREAVSDVRVLVSRSGRNTGIKTPETNSRS